MATLRIWFLRVWHMKYGKIGIIAGVLLVLIFAHQISASTTVPATRTQSTSSRSQISATHTPVITHTPSAHISGLVYGGSYSAWVQSNAATTPITHTTDSITWPSGITTGSTITITETNGIVTRIVLTFPSGTFQSASDTYPFCVAYTPTGAEFQHSSGTLYDWTSPGGSFQIETTSTECTIFS